MKLIDVNLFGEINLFAIDLSDFDESAEVFLDSHFLVL